MEKSPAWDLRGVDTVAVAMLSAVSTAPSKCEILASREAGKSSDVSNGLQETQANGSWIVSMIPVSYLIDSIEEALGKNGFRSAGRSAGWEQRGDLVDEKRFLCKADDA